MINGAYKILCYSLETAVGFLFHYFLALNNMFDAIYKWVIMEFNVAVGIVHLFAMIYIYISKYKCVICIVKQNISFLSSI